MTKRFLPILCAIALTACLDDSDSDGSSDEPVTVGDIPGSEPDFERPGGEPDNTGNEPGEQPGDETPVVETPDPTTPDVGDCDFVDIGSSSPVSEAGSTQAAADTFVDRGCEGASDGSPEVVYLWTAPEDGVFTFDTEGSGYDTLLYIVDGCEGEELACNDDARNDRSSQLRIDATANQQYLIVVSGWGGEAGDFVLSIEGSESMCGDGQDNDGDGAVDCADTDCVRSAAECADGGDWPEEWIVFELEMLQIINENRARGWNCDTEGRFGAAGPLEMNDFARLAARLHSTDMGERNYFEHDNLDGLTPFNRMENAGYNGRYPWGENIAGGSPTAEDAMAGLMESDGHCANIMNPEFNVVGIGYAYVERSEFRHYWTQNFGGSH